MVDSLDENIEATYQDGHFYLFDRIVSGDFSASTDELAMEASAAAIDRCLKNLGLYGTKTGLLALMNFMKIEVNYGKSGNKKGNIKMTNGQLMGASLSFPILCMINLSTVLRMGSCEVLRMTKINGDDVSFPATSYLVSQWNRNITEVGWTKSPGKNYVSIASNLFGSKSEKFSMQINSCLYEITRGPLCFEQYKILMEDDGGKKRQKLVTPVKVRNICYHNYSLAIGHRVKSDPTITLRTIPSIWEKLHHGNSIPRCELLRTLFLMTNKTLLRQSTNVGLDKFVPNWYFPRALGGLGIPYDENQRIKCTPLQRKVASYLALHPTDVWLVEKLIDAPEGTVKALREFKYLVPPLVSRSQFGCGPLPYSQSEKFVEDKMSLVLSTHMWDFAQFGDNAEPIRKIVLNRKALENQPMMSVKKILSYVLDLVPSLPGERIHQPGNNTFVPGLDFSY